MHRRNGAKPRRHDRSSWGSVPVVVTGGASFIGSRLVETLVDRGAMVTVLDDMSSGRPENLVGVKDRIRVVRMDLEYARLAEIAEVLEGSELIFHLAAVHGGRGYIDTHPADVCSNFAIDHHILDAARAADVARVVMASSACVYPPRLQEKEGSVYVLKEEDSNPCILNEALSADIEYGWAKLMGEMQLLAFVKEYGLKGASVRFVTAYGPRENETHAIIALIYKAFRRMDPYPIWGTGRQERDFTYVDDIVEGTVLAAERISDGSAINLGTGQRFAMLDVAEMIFRILGWHPKEIDFDPSKPTGVLSRALDIRRAKKVLGWQPRFTLEEGLRRTIDWYRSLHPEGVPQQDRLLLERA